MIFIKSTPYEKTLRTKYKDFKNKLPCALDRIHGTNLPPLPDCHNFVFLAGRSIYLNGERNAVHDELKMLVSDIEMKLFDKMKEWSTHPSDEELKAFHEERYHEYYDKLVAAYEQVIDGDYCEGIVHIPCSLKSYDETFKVKSEFGDYDVYYAPLITTIPNLTGNITSNMARLFAQAVLKDESCSVITMYFKKPVDMKHQAYIIESASEFIAACNEFLIKEFNDKKDNVQYQRRNDMDPDLF